MRAARDQLFVCPFLDDRAVREDDDPVSHANGREAVGDHHRHTARHQLGEPDEYLILGPRIEGGRRLVEDQELRRAHVGARERDLLPFAAR